MNAPLSRFLTRFADDEAPISVAFEVVAAEPTVTLSVGELQSRLDAARKAALRDAEAAHARELAELATSRTVAIQTAVAEARAIWLAVESAAHAETFDQAFGALESALSTRIAAALRPLLATAVVERTCEAVRETIGHILADPEHPAVTVHGPADLIDMIRDMRATAGKPERVTYVATDAIEIKIDAAGSQVETRLSAALASLREI